MFFLTIVFAEINKLLRFARNDRHCEERSDEAIQDGATFNCLIYNIHYGPDGEGFFSARPKKFSLFAKKTLHYPKNRGKMKL